MILEKIRSTVESFNLNISEKEILNHLKKSFEERIIENVEHEIVKRTRGLIR